MPEALLHAAWRRAGASSATIAGRDGHRYRVIYAGRQADGAGPDFKDAVLLRDDGTRIHGHVEVHVRPGDWHSHGHSTDGAYNGVVLHVVSEDTGPQVDTPSGLRIPLLVLGRELIEGPAEQELSHYPAVPLPSLDMPAAGDEWFRNRVHGYHIRMADDPEQALWAGALECLGYPANRRGFRQLATRLPWPLVTRVVDRSEHSDLQAFFDWAGGFGSKPPGAPILRGRPPEWRARSGRPANRPQVRLRAAAAWSLRWAAGENLTSIFTQAVRRAGSAGQLSSLFVVPGGQDRTAIVGTSRARDIVVNHLLPAASAHALSHKDAALADHALQLFRSHPLLAPNSITREASRLLLARGVPSKPRTARDQQGLLHIYRMGVAAQRPEQQLPLH